MTLDNIPVISFTDSSEVKKQNMHDYQNIRGKIINQETMSEIFHCMRVLDEFQISPLLYFSCVIQASPKSEYINDFQLKPVMSKPLLTLPIPITEVIENTMYRYIDRYRKIEPINIQFDPFELNWRSYDEFNLFMTSVFDNYEMDDVRYDHYITVVWV